MTVAGIDWAPRLIGIEGDRERLSFIDGDVPPTRFPSGCGMTLSFGNVPDGSESYMTPASGSGSMEQSGNRGPKCQQR